MKKRFGKNDLILIGILLTIALTAFFVGKWIYGEKGTKVQVTVDGEVYGTYSLKKEQTVTIKKGDQVTNILQIEEGTAKMITANCPDQLCVHQQEISNTGQTIVCMPNKVVAEVIEKDIQEDATNRQSNDSDEMDSIVK